LPRIRAFGNVPIFGGNHLGEGGGIVKIIVNFAL